MAIRDDDFDYDYNLFMAEERELAAKVGLEPAGDSGVWTDPDEAEWPRIDSFWFDRDDD
jgi:hypothetical protein